MRPRAPTRTTVLAVVGTCLVWVGGAQAAGVDAEPPAAQAPSGEHAQGGAPDPKQVARARYGAGVEKFRQGLFKDAIDLFLEADQLAPSAALSFNVARAYQEIHDDAGALRWYRDYLRRAPDADDATATQSIVDDLEAKLAARGVMQLTVHTDPYGATLLVDERPVGITPWTGELAPGVHLLALRLRGYADVEQTVPLAADDSGLVSIRLVPKSEAPAPPAPAPAPAASTSAVPSAPPLDAATEPVSGAVSPWTWAALGGATVALGVAGGFEVGRRSAESDAETATVQTRYVEHFDTMESRQTVARIAAGVGGALLLTGGVLLFLDLADDDGAVRVRAGCGPSDCGVRLGGSL